MNLEHQHNNLSPEASEKKHHDTLEDYIEQLDLTEADLQKNILDVGSGRGASFSRKAKERGLGDKIYSIDPNSGNERSINFVRGQGEYLPFKDRAFELVVSNAAFPFFVIIDDEIKQQLMAGNMEPAENRIKQVLNDMLRVLGDNGEIRLGRVTKNIDVPSQRVLERCFEKVLAEFVEHKIISVEWKQKAPLIDYKDSAKKVADLYLVKIHKL